MGGDKKNEEEEHAEHGEGEQEEEESSEDEDDIEMLLCNDIFGDYDDYRKSEDDDVFLSGNEKEDENTILYACSACSYKESMAKLKALARVLHGCLRDELNREWCASIFGDQAMGRTISIFRFNTYSNTFPLSAAKQQALQIRSLEASMNRLRRRIAAIRSAAEARKEERRQTYYALRCAHVEERERHRSARRAAEENGEEVEEEEDQEKSERRECEIANEEEEDTHRISRLESTLEIIRQALQLVTHTDSAENADSRGTQTHSNTHAASSARIELFHSRMHRTQHRPLYCLVKSS